MARHSRSTRMQALLSLISITQITLTTASPVPCGCERFTTVLEVNAAPRIPVAAAPSDMSGVLPLPSNNPVVQIVDGQIQAPYTGLPFLPGPAGTITPSLPAPLPSQQSQGTSSASQGQLTTIPDGPTTTLPSQRGVSESTSQTAALPSLGSVSQETQPVYPASRTQLLTIMSSLATSLSSQQVVVPQTTLIASQAQLTTFLSSSIPTLVSASLASQEQSTSITNSLVTSQAAVSSLVVPVVTVTPTTVVTTTVPDTLLTSLTTSAIQTPSLPVPTNTIGSLHTSLEASGVITTLPFVTVVPTATTALSLISSISVTPTASINATSININEIFQAIATDTPPAQISQRSDHPVARLGISPQQKKLETNKFYANLFLGSQTSGVFTLPYVITWLKGHGSGGLVSWGLAISHSERSAIGFGPAAPVTGAASFYTNPIGVQPVVLSAAQLSTGTTLTTDSLAGFSVNANLVPAGASSPMITLPLVQGSAFTTAIYSNGATPLIDSGVGITNVTYSGTVNGTTGGKYRLALSDKSTWLVYVFTSDTTYATNMFTLLNPNRIQGPSGFEGYIQVAKLPMNATYEVNYEETYDAAAGVYPTAASISGTVDGTVGTYSLSWTKGGITDRTLLMFALPHHTTSFSAATSSQLTGIQLMTPTKGMGSAVLADSWTLVEPTLSISMSFAPWSQAGSMIDLSPQAQELVNAAATAELAQDISAQTDLNSMYFSGKGLSKFAAIVYATHDMAHNATLALTGLEALKSAFEVFVNNQQINPLVYDTVWGGAVSISSYNSGNSGDDFGNTYYNDHHFHYGYFVYTAAVIGYLDPTWLTDSNKAWVNMLVRDYANPVDSDPYFPFSRSFDWYHGHSWAKGLFESADGKDQESSSEDTMASYGLKMWGKIIGDVAMEARGNLMLAVQARSLADYYLYTSDNTVEPPQFIPNKAAGILFENKIDHTTYFGTAIEDIEGIHMIPIMPFSTLTRRATFVAEEWNTYFQTYINSVTSGWRGILMANLAIVDPKTSFNFFANYSGTFQPGMLDGGASQTCIEASELDKRPLIR
ncbi:hypothetical protein AMS68_004779 [Peltaster fructicola]|uniref:glucan endo-1,3-beta-D-glucosidase n=1 Tax=Peltaster fructicola TaxID=286661 RepID=A0A6H0XWW1_9PEZI|nr:hypothetical protein AMS68_004779 [Peltaster fructicola]